MSFSVFKNFFIGISIFLVPYYLFLTPHNFKWVDESSVSNIFIFSFIIIILLIIISFLTNLFFFIIFKKKIQSIFILYCFGFFFIIFICPFKRFIFYQNIKFFTSFNRFSFYYIGDIIFILVNNFFSFL